MYTFIKKNLLLIGVVACLYPLQVSAQDKLSVHAKADFVSDYVWRGADQQSGCSVQPSLTLGYAGFSLNVWGSQSLTKWEEGGSKEWDINLGYTFNLKNDLKIRLAGSVQNVCTFTKYSGLDPEINDTDGVDTEIYPRPRLYTIRLNITF